jgi:3-hydroxy-3-methylglutaryl CoA synthase
MLVDRCKAVKILVLEVGIIKQTCIAIEIQQAMISRTTEKFSYLFGIVDDQTNSDALVFFPQIRDGRNLSVG